MPEPLTAAEHGPMRTAANQRPHWSWRCVVNPLTGERSCDEVDAPCRDGVQAPALNEAAREKLRAVGGNGNPGVDK